MTPDLAIKRTDRTAIIEQLNLTVADLHLIYVKTRNYHWNVKGNMFFSLHALFERQYDALKLQADQVAERVRMLGGLAIGTMTEFLESSRLSEEPRSYPSAETMIQTLLTDHETMIGNLRDAIETCSEHGDAGSEDLLTAQIQMHEEMAWMLRATLNG